MATENKGNKIDPYLSLAKYVLTNSKSSVGLYSNVQMDGLLESIAAEADFDKRKAYCRQAQELWMSESPVIPVAWMNEVWAARNNLKNWQVERSGLHRFRGASLEK
jgi:ABC-type transport system substrate-binding protein